MRTRRLPAALAALLASGLIAAGCGRDATTTVTSEATSVETTATTSTDATSTATEPTTTSESTSSDSTSSSSGGVDASSFYDTCINAASGPSAQEAVKALCGQARDALERCATLAQSGGDEAAAQAAVKTCQDAADAAVKQLQAAGG